MSYFGVLHFFNSVYGIKLNADKSLFNNKYSIVVHGLLGILKLNNFFFIKYFKLLLIMYNVTLTIFRIIIFTIHCLPMWNNLRQQHPSSTEGNAINMYFPPHMLTLAFSGDWEEVLNTDDCSFVSGHRLTVNSVATASEKVWKMKFFPGQGKVREFQFQSGNKWQKSGKSQGIWEVSKKVNW